MSVAKCKEMSNKYGRNSEYVLAGGGNTSYKDENHLYVKGSGVSLATIGEDGFVKLERRALREIFVKTYSDNDDEREAAVLVDLLAAKCAGQDAKRPSVEALLHDVLPFSYVLHIHPSMVIGITCGKDGKACFDKLFGKDGIWIPPIMPGYILAAAVKNEVEIYQKANGKPPLFVFLENHGVFIGGCDVETIDSAVDEMNSILKSVLKRTPDFSDTEFDV